MPEDVKVEEKPKEEPEAEETEETPTPIPTDPKLIWKSKTFWVAFVTMLIGIFGAIQPFMQEYEPKYLYIVIFIIGVLGVILRMLTGKPVTMKMAKKVVDDTKEAKEKAEKPKEEPAKEEPKKPVEPIEADKKDEKKVEIKP